VVSAGGLVKGRGNLDEPLEKQSQLAFFAQPRLLPRLVRVEEASIIEKRTPPLDCLRRSRPHRLEKRRAGLIPALLFQTVDCRLSTP
jgi:hypothetical protein